MYVHKYHEGVQICIMYVHKYHEDVQICIMYVHKSREVIFGFVGHEPPVPPP